MKTMIPRLHLEQDGLAMFLGGEGQAAVYRAIVASPGNIHHIRQHVCLHYGQAGYTTVATQAKKLVDKGIVQRVRKDKYKAEYTYTALLEEEALIEHGIKLVIAKLLDTYPDTLGYAWATLVKE